MSGRIPSVKVLEREYVTRRIRTSGVTADVARAEFHRAIAEAERAAAEKAWWDAESAFAQAHDLDNIEPWGHIPENPYRRNEGENE